MFINLTFKFSLCQSLAEHGVTDKINDLITFCKILPCKKYMFIKKTKNLCPDDILSF